MATRGDKNTMHLNDLVSLPIIITDYDAATTTEHRKSGSSTGEDISSPDSPTATNDAASIAAPRPKYTTGFSDFADELWSRMTAGMRGKLREACIEVLKRTDDSSEDHESHWDHDDTARFLD